MANAVEARPIPWIQRLSELANCMASLPEFPPKDYEYYIEPVPVKGSLKDIMSRQCFNVGFKDCNFGGMATLWMDEDILGLSWCGGDYSCFFPMGEYEDFLGDLVDFLHSKAMELAHSQPAPEDLTRVDGCDIAFMNKYTLAKAKEYKSPAKD